MGYTQLIKKYDIAKSSLSKRINKDGWVKAKSEPLIERQVNAVKELRETAQESEQLGKPLANAVRQEVDRRLRLEGIFMNAVEYNQVLANKILEQKGENAELHELNIHSQLTARNKESVVGRMPTTQVNIQTNVSTDADSVLTQIAGKHEH